MGYLTFVFVFEFSSECIFFHKMENKISTFSDLKLANWLTAQCRSIGMENIFC